MHARYLCTRRNSKFDDDDDEEEEEDELTFPHPRKPGIS